MKLAWFSPLPPAHSDIANFTHRLGGELRIQFEVRFLTETGEGFLDPDSGIFYHACLGPHPYELLVSLSAGDLPIYNLGNHPGFFAQTWFLNQLKPGIVILHDVKMHHFFEGVYRERLHDESSYLEVLRKYHGAFGRQAGVAFCRSRLSIEFMAQNYPMTAWAVRNALAVVVHTAWAHAAVRKVCSTPVWTIPLPYEPSSQVDPKQGNSTVRSVKLIVFGFLNANRRIIEFLHALATMHERDHFEVHLVGTLQQPVEVCAAVELLGLRARVTFHGYVSDDRLDKLLAAADLAVNLRYPTMGEASGSQLRIWDHALPSLVTDIEGYADLPPDTVFFVRLEHEREDIQRHLRHFLRRPGLFREKGRRGRKWLLERHAPAMYVEALRPICEAVDNLRSRHNRLMLADRIGHATSSWADAMPSGDRERFYAARIAEIT